MTIRQQRNFFFFFSFFFFFLLQKVVCCSYLSFSSAHNDIDGVDLEFLKFELLHFLVQRSAICNHVVSVNHKSLHLMRQDSFHWLAFEHVGDLLNGFGDVCVLKQFHTEKKVRCQHKKRRSTECISKGGMCVIPSFLV